MTPVAVIGMACRFPGAPDLDTYWRLIRDGGVVTGPVGADRWRHAPFYSPHDSRAADTAYTDRVAHLDDVRSFGALHYGLPPRRVEVTDPQHRLMLELSREALQDAGLERRPFRRASTAVYVGASVSEYRDLLVTRIRARQVADGQFGEPMDAGRLAGAVARVAPVRAYSIPGTLLNLAASVVSHAFGLGGPSLVVDAACASALVAVHQAAAQLATGACDLAIAGGVYLNLVPDNLVGFSRIGALSRSGACRPFDRRADGFVLGEGAGVVVLKRLTDALADRDRIYAVVLGGGCTNDGQADGPMTPRADGQVACLRQAYADAGVSPGSVSYVECHGTATPTGDAVELAALRQVWHTDATAPVPCAVGSVKANIGHTMSAAGIAGFIKAVLALHHATIPAQPGCEQVDPELGLDAPFRVAAGPAPWPGGEDHAARRAAVSAFGFGGTNAHLVLEAAPARGEVPVAQPEWCVLSAGTPQLLAGYAQRLAAVMAERGAPPVADVAYTLALRSALPARAAVDAATPAGLVTRLTSLADALRTSGPAPPGVLLTGEDAPDRVAAWFATGDDVDLVAGMPADGRRLTHLPAAPIEREPYWAVRAHPTGAVPSNVELPPEVTSVLLTEVSKVSEFSTEALRLDARLAPDLGFDSLLVEELSERLGRTWPAASSLPADLLRRDTTLQHIAGWLATLPRGTAAPDPAALPEVEVLAKRRAMPAALGVPDPYFVVHDGARSATTWIDSVELLDFAGSDYLGLAGDPAVAAAAKDAIDRYGTSVSASRVASGERPIHRELEAALAAHLGTGGALAFVSAHATNVTVLGHLLKPGDLVVYDALAHDSILQGARLSGAQRRAYPHNDLAALDRILAEGSGQYRRVVIAVEGVYSMDGDLAPLPGLIRLRDRYRAMLYVDEAHAIGVLGGHGRGSAEHWGIDPTTVDLWMGTLSKALASSGGYVAGPADLVSYLRYSAPGFVYSTGLAPPVAGAALAAVRRLTGEPRRAGIAPARAHLFRRLAHDAGWDTGSSEAGSAIVPLMVGDTAAALRLADRLRRGGLSVPPIVHPAVGEEQARLRFSFNANHSEADVHRAARTLPIRPGP